MRLPSERVLRIAHATSAGAGIWLLVGVIALLLPVAAVAQVATVPVGSTVRIADTGGQRLNLRVGPGRSAAPITSLPEGTVLAVVGPEAEADGLRWLNVREPGGKVGWSAARYLQVVASPTVATPPPATATPTATPTPAPVGTPGMGSPGAGPTAAATGALAIDARVKLPETDGRDQTLTVTVTRGGAPVVGAQVVSVTGDTDPPIVREFDPTDAQGKTVKTFDIRQEKGTVVVVIVAVAPDGAKANTTATYYRR